MEVSLDPMVEHVSWKELEDYYGSPALVPLVHDSTLPVDVLLEFFRDGKGYATVFGDITDFGSTATELTRDQVNSMCEAVKPDSARCTFDDSVFPEFGITVSFDYGTLSPAEFLDTHVVKESLNRFEQYLSGNPFAES